MAATPIYGKTKHVLYISCKTLTYLTFLKWSGERLRTFSFFFRGMLQKPPKAGNYRPASETPLKWRLAGGPIMAHIECWLGSFVIFRGSGPVLIGNPMNLWFFRGGGGGGGGGGRPPFKSDEIASILFIHRLQSHDVQIWWSSEANSYWSGSTQENFEIIMSAMLSFINQSR